VRSCSTPRANGSHRFSELAADGFQVPAPGDFKGNERVRWNRYVACNNKIDPSYERRESSGDTPYPCTNNIVRLSIGQPGKERIASNRKFADFGAGRERLVMA
jgi:hypothetical protein